ncbi:hypothetical protein BKA70DRAFT_1113051, partial [Coprinopsis sp. MPI-PUGE-AT-0042]
MSGNDGPPPPPQRSPSAENDELVRRRVNQAESLVQDVLDEKVAYDDFMPKLRELGISPTEAKVYLDLLEQSLEQQGPMQQSGREKDSTNGIQRPSTPEGLQEPELSSFRVKRDRELAAALQRAEEQDKVAADKAAWDALDVLAKGLKSGNELDRNGKSGEDFFTGFGTDFRHTSGQEAPSPRAIPASVLAAAPHLANLAIVNEVDPIISATWKLRQAFAADKAVEAIADRMQAQPFVEPLPRSIWKPIIQDLYVDFTKLHAAIDPSSHFQHIDESKELGGGLMLVKKEHLLGSKEVRDEGEWGRVFAAWEAAVVALYPHRKVELRVYRSIVEEHFRIAPSQPSIAIGFDRDVRFRYSKQPFRMDDRGIMATNSLANIFSFASTSRKASSGRAPLSKRLLDPTQRALLLSKLDNEKRVAEMSAKVDQAARGPRSVASRGVKRGRDVDVEGPRFRRGYVWSSSSRNTISPSALYTESAAPLPSPPDHLLHDPQLASTITALGDAIKKTKGRVITDHSASGLNDGIPREDAKVRYDDMRTFGQVLYETRSEYPSEDFLLFKSDVASAFLNLPAHPLWQLRQVVTIDGLRHIIRLLEFWDDIGCPWEDAKQEFGTSLTIIGFWVDYSRGSISLSPNSINDMKDAIRDFLSFDGRNPPLRRWQQITGHLNWALNVIPWGRPALS